MHSDRFLLALRYFCFHSFICISQSTVIIITTQSKTVLSCFTLLITWYENAAHNLSGGVAMILNSAKTKYKLNAHTVLFLRVFGNGCIISVVTPECSPMFCKWNNSFVQ